MSSKKNCPEVLMVYGSTNNHLGLWNDLENDTRVELRDTGKRFLNSRPLFRRIFNQISRHIGTHSCKHLIYDYHDIFHLAKKVHHIVIIDGALNVVNISELKKCRSLNKKVKISLYLLNAMDAKSPIMNGVRPKIDKFNWDNIYTTDPKDAENYGYKYLGFNYYSAHNIGHITPDKTSDVFFVGGLKGGRTKLIYDLYEHLASKGFTCDFYLMPIDNKNVKRLQGIYYYKSWRPYEEILQHVQQTKCIIEIVQGGQSGATLRYVEAVCMNKKLLTNNPNIVNFPFYNPKWMRVFTSIEDVDTGWIQKEEHVEYNYKDEFSPKHFIDYLLKN